MVSIVRAVRRMCLNRALDQYLLRSTNRCMSNAAGNTPPTNEAETPIIPVAEAERFMVDCMTAVGTPVLHAEMLAAVLVEADQRGHFSHGMNRLEMYVQDVRTGITNPSAVPTILKETPATAWVDGSNGLGAVVGRFSMDLAIKKALAVGIGFVTCKGSNHYGIAGTYALQAKKQGLLGMSFTNASPLLTPTRSTQACLGTNPISLAAPASRESFVLDMATTAVSLGKIEIQMRKNQPLPVGWALNQEGKVETDAKAAYKIGSLMPLGGSEENSGYKGYGLAMFVEILCALLSDASFGVNVRAWGTTGTVANLGHCFIAINPDAFAPGFRSRMTELIDGIKKTQPADPNKPVLVPGDIERTHIKLVQRQGGIRYLKNQMDTCAKLATKLGITPIRGLQ